MAKPPEPIIKRIEDVPADFVPGTKGVTIQILLGTSEKMPNFHTRLFTIEPGGRIPEHRHDTIEHEQVMLEGEMELTINGVPRTVTAGDVVYIPAQAGHRYINRGSVPVKFLCMIPSNTPYTTEFMEKPFRQ